VFNAIVVTPVDRAGAAGQQGRLENTMYFLGLGLVFLLCKYLEVGPMATWSWWIILAPFALAVLWWAWADASGYTKRKVMERENERKSDRIERQKDALGLGLKKRR
jgi:small Trp-rich protein